jgi:proteasome-associated ATPase
MSEQASPREILSRIIEIAPPDNARLSSYLTALGDALDGADAEKEEAQRLLAEYEEAYQKLTAPANRIGVFLKWLEDRQALIAVGDTEFVSLVDPTLQTDSLTTGTRVKVNDAYAIVGALEATPSGGIFKVGELLGEDRIRLGSDSPGQDGRIVLRGGALTDTKIANGDEVRLDSTGRIAVEHFARKEVRDYFFEDVPAIPWEAIGGQDEAIKLIRETIELPLLHPEIFEKYDKKPVKGILLYGPPGCGKTLLGKATAHNLTKEYSERMGREVREYFMYISGPKILNMWLGETERMVREIFATAREKAKEGNLVFIFMDEAESVLRTRSSGKWLNISNTVVPQFCAELDGLVSLENVVLMLTSNRPDYIDPAVLRPERIDRKIKIKRPDKAAATQILAIYLHDKLPLDPEVLGRNDQEVDCARKELVEATIDFLWRETGETSFLKVGMRSGASKTLYWKDLVSGALLKSIVDRAKDFAIRRAIDKPTAPNGITLEDLTGATAAEYKENEIFPKSDVQDDWLKLLDFEPEDVAAIHPIGKRRGEDFVRRSVM